MTKGSGVIEMKSLYIADQKLTPLKDCKEKVLGRELGIASDLAALLGLPSAQAKAKELIEEGKL